MSSSDVTGVSAFGAEAYKSENENNLRVGVRNTVVCKRLGTPGHITYFGNLFSEKK